MPRLVVISNRVAVPKARGVAGAQGGLAGALNSALKTNGGIWFGWSGQETEEFTGSINYVRSAEGVTTATIDLEHQDIEEYYNGYANSTLWPLFHYRIDLTQYEREFGKGYERVNERFAESALPLIDDGDLVWVHDYHLMPLGEEPGRGKPRNAASDHRDRAFRPLSRFRQPVQHLNPRTLVDLLSDTDGAGKRIMRRRTFFRVPVIRSPRAIVSGAWIKPFSRFPGRSSAVFRRESSA